jgi:hypothetical protein
MAFVGDPPLFRPEADEVHISITFTWDLGRMGHLYTAWKQYYSIVRIGGPAVHPDPGDFEPGLYLAPGYVITTRGCPNRCAYCFVPEREGPLRELPIRDGHDILDNNLLAASRGHVDRVLNMLSRQKKRARFTGGLEARRVEPWFATALKDIRTEIGFLAYDRPTDRKPLQDAAQLLLPCFTKRRLGCYVLCGFPGDTIEATRERCQFVADLSMMPFPMYYRARDWKGRVPSDWQAFIRLHARGVPYQAPATAGHGSRVTGDGL